MNRLADRLKKLEGTKAPDANKVDCIIIRGMVGPGEKEAEAVYISGHGMSFDRLPDEDEDTFIDRAQASIRAAIPDAGILLISAYPNRPDHA